MADYYFAPYGANISGLMANYSPSSNSNYNPNNLSLTAFNSMDLSDQGLTSYQDLIILYNTVTDGGCLSSKDGSADELVNAGEWEKSDCWQVRGFCCGAFIV
jgi:hypothetical protein